MYYQFDFAVRGKPCRVGYALGIEQLKAVREDDVLAEDSVFFIHLLQFVFFVQIYAEVSVMPGFRRGHLVKLWLTASI